MNTIRVLTLAVVLLSSCSDDAPGLGDRADDPFVQLTVVPDKLALEIGEVAALQLEARRASGARETIPPGGEVVFGGGYRIASISDAGEVSGLALGQTLVYATFQDLLATADVWVRPPSSKLTGIEVLPVAATVGVDQVFQLRVVGNYAGGAVADLTLGMAGTRYRSSADSVAVVGSDGLLRGFGVGSARIEIENGGFSASVEVSVVAERTLERIEATPSPLHLAAGATAQLQVLASYSDGSVDDISRGVGVTYGVSPQGLAVVTASGLVAAGTSGTGELAVALGAATTVVPVTVGSSIPITRISIKVQHVLTSEQGMMTVPYQVLARFEDETESDITFASGLLIGVDDSQIVQLGRGVITGWYCGSTLLHASYLGSTAEEQITVMCETDPVLSILFDPVALDIPRGGSAPFRVLGKTASGNRVDLLQFMPWQPIQLAASGNAALILDPMTREVAVYGPPTPAKVTAQILGLVGVLPVNAPGSSPIGLLIRASRAMTEGETTALEVDEVHADGTWTVLDPLDPGLNISVDNSNLLLSPGAVTAQRDGVATISVNYNAMSSRAFVLIEESVDPVERLEFVPSSATMGPGDVTAANLIAYTTSGASLDVTFDPRVSYNLSGPIDLHANLADIVVSANGSGLASVSAGFGGATASLPVAIGTTGATLVGLVINLPTVLELSLLSVPVSVFAVWSDQSVSDISSEPGLTISSDNLQVIEVGADVLLLRGAGVANLTARYQGISVNQALEVVE